MNVLPPGPGPAPPKPVELSFLESRAETPTSNTYWFSTQGTGFAYRSNQAIRLLLPDSGDPRPWRLFSLSSSPTEEGRIAITVKQTDSPYKQRLRRLQPGERVTGFGPWGDLFYSPTRPALFIAGGIGVSPFRGMMRYASDTGATQPIVLLYSSRVPEELAFRAELDAISAAHPHFRVWYTVTRPSESSLGWRGRTGRIDEAWIRDAVVGMSRPKVYVAGLPRMAHEMVAMLKERLGYPEEDLEYEYFMGY